MKLFLNIAFSALLVPFYLLWGRDQVETQLDKMQANAFDSPGAEAPVPPGLLLGSVGLVSGHLLWGRMLGLRMRQALAGLLIGWTLGIAAFLWRLEQDPR